MKREVYLDNSATTKCSEGVIAVTAETMRNAYGNPSSMHEIGIRAEDVCKKATDIIAGECKILPKEIIYTSGGTESDNLAIKGIAHAYGRLGRHIITSQVEHPAVLNVMKQLEGEDFKVTYLPVDSSGVVNVKDYEEALTKDTILTSIMMVNNEVGSVMPIEEMAAIKKKKCPDSFFHTDAVQGFSKYKIFPHRLGIDAMSISGHKFHGPKGIGALYIRDGVRIIPEQLGGGQQNGLRSGTHPVYGIAGLGQAVKEAYTDFDEKVKGIFECKKYLYENFLSMEGVKIIGPSLEEGVPHIICASFAPVKSEVLLHELEEYGIYVSSGSACSTNKPGISATMKALGLEKGIIDSALRFSLSEYNTLEEMEYCVETLKAVLPKLSKYSRR